jgi:hypothetical protein
MVNAPSMGLKLILAVTLTVSTCSPTASAQSGLPNPAVTKGTKVVVAPRPPSSSGNAQPVSNAPKYTDGKEFALWNKYEDVAIHFNTLIMQLRTQALAAIAGVVTVGGLAISFAGKSTRATQWHILFGTIFFLTLAWVSLGALDLLYYDRLLTGAVNAILEHEDATSVLDSAGKPIMDGDGNEMRTIILSRRISQAVPNHFIAVGTFYGLIFLGLLSGLIYTGLHFRGQQLEQGGKLECTIDRAPSDKLQLTVEPAVPANHA